MKTSFFKKIETINFQLIAIIFTCVYISALLLLQSGTFKSKEKEPVIIQPTDSMQQLATKVTTGLHINSFPIFNFETNRFAIDGTIWFRFPIGTESLETIKHFSLHNSVQIKLATVSEPIIKLIGGDALVSFHISMEFKAELNFELFPIGDHILYIMFHNKTVTPHELIFDCQQEGLTLSNRLLVSNWIPIKKSVKTGYIKSELVDGQKEPAIEYPCVLYAIYFENVGIADLSTLYFPMFVLFFIILFALIINITDITRLNIIASSVPILVLFRLVINGISPALGYSTHVDYVYYLLVFISLLILFFQTYVTLTVSQLEDHTEEEKKKIVEYLEKINGIMILVALALIIMPLTYNAYYLFTHFSAL